MKRVRRLDEKAVTLQRRGELGTFAPAVGQEAAQVGSAFALAEDDWLVPSFREHPALLTRGASMAAVLTYAAGLEEGAKVPEGARFLPPAIPVGSQAVHAAGLGWGEAIRDSDAAAMVYFGDGATSEGDVYEAMNVAGVLSAQTVFMEPTRIYRAFREEVPDDHTVPFGEARTVQEGDDVTLVAWGGMVRDAAAAAEAADASVEVLDLRTVFPLDSATVAESVRKTGRCVVVHEAHRTAGIGAEVIARLNEDALYYLEGPVERVTGFDVPVPMFAREDAYRPGEDRVRAAIERIAAY